MSHSRITSSQGPRRLRNRARISCTVCHVRKQRCNRKRPCEACTAKGHPEACRYDGDLPSLLGLQSRIERLESDAQTKSPPRARPAHRAAQMFDDRFDSSATTSLNDIDYADHIGKNGALEEAYGPNGVLCAPPDNVADRLERIGIHYEASFDQNILSDLAHKGPVLLKEFLKHDVWIRHPGIKVLLRDHIRTFPSTVPQTNGDLESYTLLCACLANAALTRCSEGEDGNLFPQRLQAEARKLLSYCSMLDIQTLSVALAWETLSRYYLVDHRISDAHLASQQSVLILLRLKVHRQGADDVFDSMQSPNETETLRRLWWTVVYTERVLSLTLKRHSISVGVDNIHKSGLSEVDYEHVWEAQSGEVRRKRFNGWLHPPTVMTIVKVRQQIAIMLGNIITMREDSTITWHAARSRVAEILDNVGMLEQHLSVQFSNSIYCDPEEIVNDPFGFICIHQCLIKTDFDSLRITLYRFLWQAKDNQASRDAKEYASLLADYKSVCLAAARSNFRNLKPFMDRQRPESKFAVQLGTYRWFNSIITFVCCILDDVQSEAFEQNRREAIDMLDTALDPSSTVLSARQVEVGSRLLHRMQSRPLNGSSSVGTVHAGTVNDNLDLPFHFATDSPMTSAPILDDILLELSAFQY